MSEGSVAAGVEQEEDGSDASIFGWTFSDPKLLRTALIHRSWAHENGETEHFERLEFLGDAVLGLVTSEILYREHPDRPEGEMTRLKAHVVSEPRLARYARSAGLGQKVRLGVGEERSGGRRKSSILADVFEAILGAIYLDGGLAAARNAVRPFLDEAMDRRPATLHLDAKTRLQEEAQALGWELPEYELVAETGPDHRKRFEVSCRIRGEEAGRGLAPSKKGAEQIAAAEALAWVEARGGGGESEEE